MLSMEGLHSMRTTDASPLAPSPMEESDTVAQVPNMLTQRVFIVEVVRVHLRQLR